MRMDAAAAISAGSVAKPELLVAPGRLFGRDGLPYGSKPAFDSMRSRAVALLSVARAGSNEAPASLPSFKETQ